MKDIKLPIFVGEADDLTSFDVVMDAENHLEAIDVRAGIYKGFDAEGRRLRVEADERDRTHITLAETAPTGAAELKDSLEDLLRRLGELPEPPPGGHSLSYLVERAHSLLGVSDPGPFTRLLGYGILTAFLACLLAAFSQLIWEDAALWQRLAVGIVVAVMSVAALVIVSRVRKERQRGQRVIP